ncbi:MAG: hypothetical protein HY359_14755 [Candidatus Rokubacteria bacterium]|nr:hypothetical protein [Candidatus Rokubacteria bacterium]
MFRDRAEAGRALAAELVPLVTPPCVVAAIPRGGVAVALPIAERLRAPLTVVYARKLTSPVAPELAFGALDEDGEVQSDPVTMAWLRLEPGDVQKVKAVVWAEIQRRMSLYRVPPLARYLPGATVVLVDDGLATGLTMGAALLYARRHGAREVIVATPCAAAPAAERFQRAADRLVALTVDPGFTAVGAYYHDFSEVSDEQVLAMLARARESAGPAPGPAGLLVSFKNPRGLRLAGRLLAPGTGGPRPCVVFAHDRDHEADAPRNWTTAEELCAAGFAAFLFDFTGHGESEGAPEESTPAHQAEELGAALDTLETLDEVDAGRVGIVASGSGSAAALRRAAHDARVRALVLRCPRPDGAGATAPVAAPTLVLVGRADAPGRRAAEGLLPSLAGPRLLELVPSAAPLLGDPEALREASRRTVAWLRTYLADGEAGGGP